MQLHLNHLGIFAVWKDNGKAKSQTLPRHYKKKKKSALWPVKSYVLSLEMYLEGSNSPLKGKSKSGLPCLRHAKMMETL